MEGGNLQTPSSRGEFVFRRALVFVMLILAAVPAEAATLLLKDGRALVGRFVEVSSVAESALSPKSAAGGVALTPLILVDDGLRRTFVHRNQLSQVLEQDNAKDVRINLWQPVAERGGAVGRLGPAVKVSPFDEFGRRVYEMRSTEGLVTVVQGITQITPLYTRVQGLSGGPKPIVWDMRIATSSIPREALSKILRNAVKPDDLEGRLQIVRLFLQSERYRDAGNELEQILKDFPDRKDLEQDVRQLRQLGARLILKEIQLRAKAGQHKLARELLTQFPNEGVSGETLAQVRELLDAYTAQDAHRKTLVDQMNAQVSKIADENGRKLAESFAQEIATEVNEETISRLASFERLNDDANLTPEQKVALAISGWLVGANQATDNFQLAVSLAQVRDKVRLYLREPAADKRMSLAAELHDIEVASVERVAQLLKLMKPPLDVEGAAERRPREYELPVQGLTGEADFRYFVGLPPEYDPLRKYPTIVTLGDAGVSPQQMLDFWAGPVDEANKERFGQATRQGYIVIAVDWQQPHQHHYGYSAREHHAALGSLRDACRRFAVDTDRVYLTGHGMGGDAAWDIGIAHPDVWAGVVPVAAVASRFVERYSKNAPAVPWYVISGELDGDKMAKNSTELDRYLKPNNDVTVVEYMGRGYEPFGDEIQRLFDWMGRKRRTMPKEFEYVTMRLGDNFFWWVEVNGLPEKSMVAPANWPPQRGARPFQFESKVLTTNKLIVTSRADQTTVWLSPELVDFSKPLVVELNNRSISPRDRMVAPDLSVLLEDARTRADRLHPFWAKLSNSTPAAE